VNDVPKLDSEAVNSQLDEILNITAIYQDDITKQHISSAAVSLLGHDNLTETLNQYTLMLDTDDLVEGTNILTIYAQNDNYQSQTIQIFVEILVRATYLNISVESIEKNNGDTINTQFYENLNITALYRDNNTNAHLTSASVEMLGIGNFDEIGSQFNFSLSTTILDNGINILTIFAQLDGYQAQTFQLFINVTDRTTELLLYIDDIQKFDSETIVSQFDKVLNITIVFRDDLTKQHISSASVSLLGFENLTESGNQYTLLFDTNNLTQNVNVLTILSSKENFASKTIQIFIDVQERETYLNLFVEGLERFDSDTINTQFDEYLNITVLYRDNNSKTHLTSASVEILGIGNFDEIGSQFNYSLGTTTLEEGINILTIFAHFEGYQAQTFQLFINVSDRATALLLYIDDGQKFDTETIVSQFDESLNVTIIFLDDLTKQHISSASVELLGFGNLTENGNQYTILFNTNNLSQGINVLTILSSKENFFSKTIQIFIDVQERETYLNLFVEGLERFDSDTINTQFDEYLNITVLYRDNNTNAHLTSASVEILGIGNFTEIGSQFNFSINTNLLEKGINIITIFAQLDGYKPQVIQFFMNVDNRETGFYLLVNGLQKNQSDTIQFEANELINITIYFEDYITKTHLSGANIELLGIGLLNETVNHYNITINSNDLVEGINILTIFAQLTNYQPKSIQFFIEVVERATQLQLFLNGQDKTVDPVIDLPIGSLLNITVKYFDNQTGFEISSAILQLIGESSDQNLTESLSYKQYFIILDTSILLTGVKQFTLVAQVEDYQINSIDIRININRIGTSLDTLSGEKFVSIDPLDDYRIKMVFNNTDFGGLIKNASLTYRWDNGYGQLLDLDNNGIYEILLTNVPAGTYIISISAFAGDDYEFQSIEIVLNVIAPPGPDIMLLLISTAAGVLGLSVFMVLYVKVLKYPPKVRKVRKLKNKIGKGKKMKEITLETREEILNNKVLRNKELFEIEPTETKKGGELQK
jgi:hypothetical protein